MKVGIWEEQKRIILFGASIHQPIKRILDIKHYLGITGSCCMMSHSLSLLFWHFRLCSVTLWVQIENVDQLNKGRKWMS
jgi:hypothetical protein